MKRPVALWRTVGGAAGLAVGSLALAGASGSVFDVQITLGNQAGEGAGRANQTGNPVAESKVLAAATRPGNSSICASQTLRESTQALVSVVCSTGQFVSIERASGQQQAGVESVTRRYRFGPGLLPVQPHMRGSFNIEAGTVTALRIGNLNDLKRPLEMLVSF